MQYTQCFYHVMANCCSNIVMYVYSDVYIRLCAMDVPYFQVLTVVVMQTLIIQACNMIACDVLNYTVQTIKWKF